MKNPHLSIFAAILVALPLSLAANVPALAQENCLGKRQIQQAIDSGEIMPLDQALAEADRDEQPLSVKVCDVDGSPTYQVNIINQQGEGERIFLKAKRGEN